MPAPYRRIYFIVVIGVYSGGGGSIMRRTERLPRTAAARGSGEMGSADLAVVVVVVDVAGDARKTIDRLPSSSSAASSRDGGGGGGPLVSSRSTVCRRQTTPLTAGRVNGTGGGTVFFFFHDIIIIIIRVVPLGHVRRHYILLYTITVIT